MCVYKRASGNETVAMHYKVCIEWRARRPADCCYYVCTANHGISADITNTKLHNGHSWSDQEPSPGEGAGSERGTFTWLLSATDYKRQLR